MSDELALSTVGIKRPPTPRTTARTSIRDADRQRKQQPVVHDVNASRGVQPRRVLSPTPIIADQEDDSGESPSGTTVRLDRDLARTLDQTARRAGVSANQLALAALEQALVAGNRGMPIDGQRARMNRSTTKRKLRVPGHLRARADAIRAKESRISRSRLINAAIRRGLPDDPRTALALVIVAATAVRARTA